LILPVQAARYFEHAQILMALHLPVLAWAGVGICILGLKSSSEERFAFLIKSLEVFITGGLYLMAGMAFGMITFGMFQALSIELPDFLQRLVIAGGVGLLPVIAVASIYDPHLSPALQDFRQGLSRFIANMMRLLLPLTLGVLVIYCFVIPFNFLEPFKNRDVLIVYNVMLFAVMALLLGATPIRAGDLSQKVLAALRGGILAVAALAALISLYAMSATVYRTIYQGGITMNRLTIIGWNAINIGILVLLLVCLLWKPKEHWIDALKSVFSIATVGYVVWAVFLIIAVPLLFL
jgi:hypothetical protein